MNNEIHNVTINLEIELKGLTQKQINKITFDLFNNEDYKIAFEDLDKITSLSKRPIQVARMDTNLTSESNNPIRFYQTDIELKS